MQTGRQLLTDARGNTKTRKTSELDHSWRIVTLSLAHSTTARDKSHPNVNLCQGASKSCIDMCVADSGLSTVFLAINQARVRKTHLFLDHRHDTLCQLIGELQREHQICRSDEKLASRLNCFSDLVWESPAWGCIPQLFNWADGFGLDGRVQFYDYSKLAGRFTPTMPSNLSLCISWSGENVEQCHRLLMAGFNCAIPFASMEDRYVGNRSGQQPLPAEYKILGDVFKVIDGDQNDMRCLDPKAQGVGGRGHIVGLRFKVMTTLKRREGLKTSFIVTDWT